MHTINPLCQQNISSYNNQLCKQLKQKAKQIRFLQDKILLMQRQRQSKITQMQSKFIQQMSTYKQTLLMLQQQNIQLRRKLQKRQLSYTQLQQSYHLIANQIKILTQSNNSHNKHSKSIKRKCTQLQHQLSIQQQQNMQLKSLINILQKQVRQITVKNIRLLQQKNWLMTTYNNYEQMRNIHQQQYQKQLQLIKTKLKQQMNQNTNIIINQQLSTNINNISNSNVNVNDSRQGDNYDSRQGDNQQRVNNKQSKEDMNQNDNNIRQQARIYQKKVNRLQYLIEQNRMKNIKRVCNRCGYEQSWSQDIIKLKHIISYGQHYLSSITNNNHQQQQQSIIQTNDDKKQTTQPNITFNHSQSQQILKFLLELVSKNNYLQNQIKLQQQLITKLKNQYKQQNQSLLNQLNSLINQQQHKNITIQALHKQYQHKLSHQQQSHNKQLQQIKHKLYYTQQKYNQSKTIISIISKLTAKYIIKLLQHQQTYHQYSSLQRTTISQNINTSKVPQIKAIKKSTQIKFKKVLISILFIFTLKKSSHQLRRKALLIAGFNSNNNNSKKYSQKSIKDIQKFNQSQQQVQQEVVLSENNKSLSQLYTQSTYDLIFKHYHIDRQFQIQYQFNPNHYHSLLKNKKIHQHLQKCLYQCLKDQIITPKSKRTQNLQLQKFYNQLQENKNSTKSNVSLHQTAIKIIFQQIFLQNII